MNKTIAGAALAFCLAVVPVAHAQTAQQEPKGSECQRLGSHLQAGARAVARLSEPTGSKGFLVFRQAVASSARKSDAGLAGRIDSLEPGKPVPSGSGTLASCLLRRYLVARYGDRIVSDLQEMVRFRTFAEEGEGKTNWDAPEFGKQRKWLEARARKLGLEFKTFDGRVEEITLPGPKPILAVLTHGDVQDVKGQTWSSPPWDAKIVNGRMIGRGTEDDKGPIVVTLYSMAALRDTGWPLDWTLRLLVANAEESSWEDVPYYLERAPMPDRTLGIDANYPVTHAQKAYGLLTFRVSSADAPEKSGSWRVVKMSGGSGNSIIPERGEAVLEWVGDPAQKTTAFDRLSGLAAQWTQAHTPANLGVSQEGDHFKVTAQGRGGHTSEPNSGHNALGDLVSFLSGIDPRLDTWGSLAAFMGKHVGTETDGASLGIAHTDPVMGPLTSSLVFLLEEEGAPTARINIRVPKGITARQMEESLAKRAAAFQSSTRGKIETRVQLFNEPHFVPAEGDLVANLLAVWEEVTGTTGKPIAIGGGTQARLFKDGIDFGPAWPGLPYRGHGTDEYLTIEELHRIGELTIAALWRLAGAK